MVGGEDGARFRTLPDGPVMIAAGGEQQTILRWSAGTGEPIGQPLVGHDATVTGLAFLSLPDGRLMLISVDDDGQVMLATNPF